LPLAHSVILPPRSSFFFGWDDTLDIFASHAIGGVVGNILTGFFAQKSVAGFDGITEISGGWLDHNWKQLAYQLANSAAGMGYSFVVTTIILWVMHFIPFLCLRCNEDTEIIGVDDGEMGEYAYDYVGVDIEIGPRHLYSGDAGATGGGRESPMHHEVKTSIASNSGLMAMSPKSPAMASADMIYAF